MKILIIEDEHTLANLLKEGLTDESFAVDVCYDGETGCESARHGEYDLIILDEMLPNGIEVCKSLRAEPNHTPILMLTPRFHTQGRTAGRERRKSGADSYLAKPFSVEKLLAHMKALLDRPGDSIGDVLTVDDLSLNTATKEVRRANKPIQLTAKEYAVLEYLLRNKNRVLSKNTISNHVWALDADIHPNTVEALIFTLRSKIDKPFPGPPIIQTLRGFGYRIGDRT